MKVGLDIGSTTVKAVVINNQGNIVYKVYERHNSQIVKKAVSIIKSIRDKFNLSECSLAISGSAGMGLAERIGIDFVQEVYATRIAAKILLQGADVIIELGGEDAKILFLSGGSEVRMNGTCAGGTGAFIDQMAVLLNLSVKDMNDLAAEYKKVYSIASRCGVFAKSDIQPLLNQGAEKSDIAASILFAVANQTVSGLAQGREICGNVVYLGGPLTFMPELRHAFDKTLKVSGNCPEDSLYFVAIGAALSAENKYSLDLIIEKCENYKSDKKYSVISPLFESREDYEVFKSRHNKAKLNKVDIKKYSGDAYLGIDAGSTTLKSVLTDDIGNILYSTYDNNKGSIIESVKALLEFIYENYPNIKIKGSAVTGYGEDILKNAFKIDYGIVETIAHFTAAKKFNKDVDFIIDIGGQDIKCFKIKNGVIENIFLNEACSSGCGSFLQTFANALGYRVEDFTKLGLFAKHPVDLGSRCTVFMNSSVKQAQKDGALISDISAGLSISVVKNALYKVIRASSKEQLGNSIVVQGGTFLNDAILRAFEKELKADVIRPDISELMGAYGAALYVMKKKPSKSSITSREEILNFKYKSNSCVCNICSNHCKLTVNMFSSGARYISGNKCERPTLKRKSEDVLNIYSYKLKLLNKYFSCEGTRETIGIPLVLNMYELLPFWYTFFKSLGFGVRVSPVSSRETYISGQNSIPSDTVCFPAKLAHGHIKHLIDVGTRNIFYPCMSYNLDEKLGDNHYNCPVVAYYPEVINANFPLTNKVRFINDYVGIHNKKFFPIKIKKILSRYFDNIKIYDIIKASNAAYSEYNNFLNDVRNKAEEIISLARRDNKDIIVLAGRPYHLDPEVNHGLDKLISSYGKAVLSEDSISHKTDRFNTSVLNQWTYHSRLYAAAKYVSKHKDMNLIQLISFGCGIDAITSDEMREILEGGNKIYTQIKIDDISSLGSNKLRIRSLFEAIKQQKESLDHE